VAGLDKLWTQVPSVRHGMEEKVKRKKKKKETPSLVRARRKGRPLEEKGEREREQGIRNRENETNNGLGAFRIRHAIIEVKEKRARTNTEK
jgi:hypothetical protein